MHQCRENEFLLENLKIGTGCAPFSCLSVNRGRFFGSAVVYAAQVPAFRVVDALTYYKYPSIKQVVRTPNETLCLAYRRCSQVPH